MNIKEKVKNTLSGTFNVLAGKKGWRATVNGYGAVASAGALAIAASAIVVGTGGIALPVLAGLALATTVNNAGNAHRAAKHHG